MYIYIYKFFYDVNIITCDNMSLIFTCILSYVIRTKIHITDDCDMYSLMVKFDCH